MIHHSDNMVIPQEIIWCYNLGIGSSLYLLSVAGYRDPAYIPRIFREDGCLMLLSPLFVIIPALLWPLVLIGLAATYLWELFAKSETYCGMSFKRKERQLGPDLELGNITNGERTNALPHTVESGV